MNFNINSSLKTLISAKMCFVVKFISFKFGLKKNGRNGGGGDRALLIPKFMVANRGLLSD